MKYILEDLDINLGLIDIDLEEIYKINQVIESSKLIRIATKHIQIILGKKKKVQYKADISKI